MANQRTTFAKRQRERDKQAKAAAKRDRRASRSGAPRAAARRMDGEGQEALLGELARLHQSYEEGELTLEQFESRRDELCDRLCFD
jgi:hypothetical protein